MEPVPIQPSPVRARRRARLERVACALNGAIFLVGAWDGLDTGAPHWAFAVNAALGFVQIGALAWSRRATLPERLPFGLAAIGMFASMLQVSNHKTGLPYAYAFASLFNVALAVWGPERFRRLVRGPRA